MDPNSLALLMGSAGGAAAGPATYVEDVFQTWLYTGNGSTQTITNGIDLSGKGGMVWTKARSTTFFSELVDTARGASKPLLTYATNAQGTTSDITAFNSNGFSLGYVTGNSNEPSTTFASWTFRKQAKFFDVVTYTGDGTAGRTVAHSLGSTPGCIIVKRTDTAINWVVYHGSEGATKVGLLNLTNVFSSNSTVWNNTAPTSTEFTLGTGSTVNASGGTYVAYLFAHDAGGFGDTGNDSIIKCGSFTTDGSGNATVNLGWEPQWVMVKSSSADDGSGWAIVDVMRNFINTSSATATSGLRANSSGAEISNWFFFGPTSNGINISGFNASTTYIYIAIRRGPMKTPTDATKVFDVKFQGSGTTAASPTFNSSFVTDFLMRLYQPGGASAFPFVVDRLRGSSPYLTTSSTAAETASTALAFDSMLGVYSATLGQNSSIPGYLLRRAPGFFDVVAYTGTGSATTFNHSLGVAPELMIVKRRDISASWVAYTSSTGNTKYLVLNSTAAAATLTSIWNDTSPTSTVFTVGTASAVNTFASTYIAYLFSSLTGISKVGSYTGTGTTLSINCGFTNGARFVLIKRTDSTGDWYVWDTARGIIAANDPFLLLNSTAAEDTSTDYIDPLSSGFQISSTAPAAINANGGSFIYLAIA